jgi:hypothetical protein
MKGTFSGSPEWPLYTGLTILWIEYHTGCGVY